MSGDLVVMDIAAFERRAKDLKLAEDLFNIRTARLNGAKGHSPDEVRRILTKTIESVEAVALRLPSRNGGDGENLRSASGKN